MDLRQFCIAFFVCCVAVGESSAQGVSALPVAASANASPDEQRSPIFGVSIPDGYRQWQLIAPSRETAPLDELRGILGNDIAMKAYRDGTLPFPDGSILAKLAWKHVASSEIAGAFVPGQATTVQFMVKDSVKYADTGGWGFGRFLAGKAADEAQHRTCFACHAANVKDHDRVFTRYAP